MPLRLLCVCFRLCFYTCVLWQVPCVFDGNHRLSALRIAQRGVADNEEPFDTDDLAAVFNKNMRVSCVCYNEWARSSLCAEMGRRINDIQ